MEAWQSPVYCNSLENCRSERAREFESHRFRHIETHSQFRPLEREIATSAEGLFKSVFQYGKPTNCDTGTKFPVAYTSNARMSSRCCGGKDKNVSQSTQQETCKSDLRSEEHTSELQSH